MIMRFMNLYACTFVMITFPLTTAYNEERSILDTLTPLLRRLKARAFNSFQNLQESLEKKEYLKLNKKIQNIPDDKTFPCNLNITLRSKEVPQNVHKLRPGDIDVIAALGDSLTAGFGALATSLLEVYFYETRGAVFSVGGQESWKTLLTLPNILKNFNPNIYGYSLNSISIDRNSKFNVAEGGAISENMPYMANILVKRIKNDKNVNLKKDWKMITIFVGHNDFCSTDCYDNNYDEALSRHERDMLEVLRILKKNLPRTIVNIVPPLDVSILIGLKDRSEFCKLSHVIACPCLTGLSHLHLRNRMIKLIDKWQKLDVEITNNLEFESDDFTLIKHLFTIHYTIPQTKGGKNDYGYAAIDCFHASQRGHAKLANDLWNSLLEPYDNKSINTLQEFERFLCPSEERPYISTKRN